jgi:NitT/TauT family transport system substrate-binding protein
VREKIPFVAIAAFYQKDPLVIITHSEVGARSLPDLKGHPILLAQFAYDSFYAWMRSKYGFRLTGAPRPSE